MKKIKIGVVSSGRSLVDTTRELAIEKGIDIQSAYLGLDDAIEAAKEMESSIHANDWEAVEHIYSLIESYSDAAIEFTNAHA